MSNKELLIFATQLENQRGKAMVGGNIEELSALLSEDLYYGHSGGYYDDRESFIGKLTSGFARYHAVTTTVHKVASLGADALTLNGEVDINVTLNGQLYDIHGIYVGVWKRTNNKWQFVAHQSAKMLEQ